MDKQTSEYWDIPGLVYLTLTYGFQGAVFPHAMFPASERAVHACLFPLHPCIIQIYLLYQSFKVQSIFKISPSRFIIPKIKNKINKIQEATTHKISQPKDARVENWPKSLGRKTGPDQPKITGWKPWPRSAFLHTTNALLYKTH